MRTSAPKNGNIFFSVRKHTEYNTSHLFLLLLMLYMRIEQELHWSKEMKALAEKHNVEPYLVDGKEKIIIYQCCYSGFPYLTEKTAEELEEHIQRLEFDINSTHKI